MAETRAERYARLAQHGGWVGVDLDATLAEYPWNHVTEEIGPPIPKMLERVKAWLAAGIDVRVFTARATVPELVPAVSAWCRQHVGRELIVTNVKDFHMIELWDDRAVQVVANTGERADGGTDA
jgi:hypothetical protein